MVKTIVKSEGMMCHMCEAHVNNAIKKKFKVKSVESSFESGVTEITSENTPDEAELRETIEAEGYKVLTVSSTIIEKKGFFKR